MTSAAWLRLRPPASALIVYQHETMNDLQIEQKDMLGLWAPQNSIVCDTLNASTLTIHVNLRWQIFSRSK